MTHDEINAQLQLFARDPRAYLTALPDKKDAALAASGNGQPLAKLVDALFTLAL